MEDLDPQKPIKLIQVHNRIEESIYKKLSFHLNKIKPMFSHEINVQIYLRLPRLP